MLKIQNLCVNVEDKKIIDDLSLEFELGKNYALLGKNGSGKSSLAMSILQSPFYNIVSGDISFNGESIVDMKTDEVAKKGIFLAFQNIPEVPGVKLFDFLKNVYIAQTGDNISFMKFKKLLEPIVLEVGLDREVMFRDLNVGFSGGEKRKVEIVQLKLLKPKYVFLDEIDSGLDINSIRQLGELLKSLDSDDTTFIIISHYFDLLDYVNIDTVIELENGKVKQTGDKGLVDKIRKEGF